MDNIMFRPEWTLYNKGLLSLYGKLCGVGSVKVLYSYIYLDRCIA